MAYIFQAVPVCSLISLTIGNVNSSFTQAQINKTNYAGKIFFGGYRSNFIFSSNMFLMIELVAVDISACN